MRRTVIALSASLFAAASAGAQQQYSTDSSYAEVWLSQKSAGKDSFLDGMCYGLNTAGHSSGKLTCFSNVTSSGQSARYQFCAMRYRASPFSKGVSQTGAEFLDAFYSNPGNSNVSIAKVVELYNERVCNETKMPRTK
jgi:hypothetical protein